MRDVITLLEIVVSEWGFKLTGPIERKIEQSVTAASQTGLAMNDLIRVASILAECGEGD